MPPKIDFNIYQGTTFSRTFFLSQGVTYGIDSVLTGSTTTLTLASDHSLIAGDFVRVTDADIIPSLSGDAYEVLSAPDSRSIELDVTTSGFRDIRKGKVQKTANTTGYKLRGQVRQRSIKALGNVLASTTNGNREIILSAITPLKVEDRITIPGASVSEERIVQVRNVVNAGDRAMQILLMESAPSVTQVNAVIESSSTLLADFTFRMSPMKGMITALMASAESASIPATADKRNYFYDIKYQSGGTISVLSYGNVTITPQITENTGFASPDIV